MSKFKEYWKRLEGIVSAHPKGRAFVGADFYPDPTPMAPPVGYVEEPSLFERMQSMVRRELARRADTEGFDTLDEAEDFEVDDEPEMFSPYELVLMQQPWEDAPARTTGSPLPAAEAASAAAVPAGPGDPPPSGSSPPPA